MRFFIAFILLICCAGFLSSQNLTENLTYISGEANFDLSSVSAQRSQIADANPNLLGISATININSEENGALYRDRSTDRVHYLLHFTKHQNGLGVIIEDAQIPDGSDIRLVGEDDGFAYNYKVSQIKNGRLFLAPAYGDVVSLQIILPMGEEEFSFSINKIYLMEKGAEDDDSRAIGFGESFVCHENINCPEGENYQKYKRGVCKILMPLEEGLAFCSGSLINNTGDELIPYVLTGFHCDNGYTPFYDMYQFHFNYESTTCANPTQEPGYDMVMGAEPIANYGDSDMRLFRITGNIPSDYNLYLNGWTRDTNYIHSALIHHPFGDIKKISIDDDPPTIHPVQINWSGRPPSPPYSHLHMTFDLGAQQPGSSGASLFNEEGFIVGQLHGGLANCGVNRRGYVGRLSVSWDFGDEPVARLKDWLDPEGTDVMSLEGREFSTNRSVRVLVRDVHGQHIHGVRVVEGIPPTLAVEEDEAYSFEAENGASLQIRLSKSSGNFNGITVVDLVLQRLHILGKIESDEASFRAADVNNDGVLTMEDLRELRNLLLDKDHTFPGGPSWIFLPNLINIPDLSEDEEVEVLGIKLGDMNFSADPTF